MFYLILFSVDIVCEKIKGNLIVSSQGGNGHKGQDGVSGRKGSKAPDVSYFSLYPKQS